MRRIIEKSTLLLVLLVLFACGSRNTTSLMKNVTGKAGELVIVIEKGIWDNGADSVLIHSLAQPQIGLPQEEPLFDLIHIPHEAFTSIFQTTRNLIVTDVNPSLDSTGVFYVKDRYARPQAFVSIKAKNTEELLKLYNENSDNIIAFFLKAEKDRLMYSYAKYYDKAVFEQADKKFGIQIKVPPGFFIAKDTTNFMWIRYETPEISQGIFIYTYPYVSDSTFTTKYLTIQRNLFLKSNVPGPLLNGTFMTTEDAVPVFMTTLKKDGNFAADLRGLWKVQDDFMGGPFVSLSIIDLLKKRVVTLDGFVYAPGKEKRNLLRQVEAIIYSVKFDDQIDMDKINQQFAD